MNKTWISVTGTVVNGWAKGPEPPTDEWIPFNWIPEKSLAAYEYIVTAGGEQEIDDPDNEGQKITIITGDSAVVRQRSDWEDPE